MGLRISKCTNYSGCKLAYRKEDIKVTTRSGSLCPECRSSLEYVGPRNGRSVFIVRIGVAVILLFSTGVMILTLTNSPKRRIVPDKRTWTPTPPSLTSLTPLPNPESTPLATSTPFAAATPAPTVGPSATPLPWAASTPELD
jgi:hypothetical protein